MSSRLIYGCMTIGGSWDDAPPSAGTVDRARAAVHAALDGGLRVAPASAFPGVPTSRLAEPQTESEASCTPA